MKHQKHPSPVREIFSKKLGKEFYLLELQVSKLLSSAAFEAGDGEQKKLVEKEDMHIMLTMTISKNVDLVIHDMTDIN